MIKYKVYYHYKRSSLFFESEESKFSVHTCTTLLDLCKFINMIKEKYYYCNLDYIEEVDESK